MAAKIPRIGSPRRIVVSRADFVMVCFIVPMTNISLVNFECNLKSSGGQSVDEPGLGFSEASVVSQK